MLLKVVFVCCLLALSLQSSGSSFFNGRIIGGKYAKEAEFPHQVSVQMSFPKIMHVCGGSIVNEHWILTSANCVVFSNFEYYVKAGLLHLNGSESTQQMQKVSKIIIHENHPNIPTVGPYDIALLKLSKPLVFNKYVQPIDLPNQDEPVDGQVTLTGWGYTEPKGLRPENTLRKQDIPIITNQDCKNKLEELSSIAHNSDSIESTNLCSGPLTGGTSVFCSGDEGGPLVKYENGKPKQVGIASWKVLPCGKYTSISVYTRVASYVDWIETKIAEN